MTFDQAMEAIKQGKAVRHKGMSPGWKMVWHKGHESHYFVNPVTGSAHAFNLKDEDHKANWKVIE